MRPVAIVTGASRRIGIGAAIARALAADGWDVATTVWRPYDESMPWGADDGDVSMSGGAGLRAELEALGARALEIDADLATPDVPAAVFDRVEAELGAVTALIANHCRSVASDIETTSIESFDAHFAINTRAVWLLVREFGRRFRGAFGAGRIVAITSDHTAGNLPYGASKGAMDRIVLAAAEEFSDRGITANVVNPGPTDTGWMNEELIAELSAQTALGRVGRPVDVANLVAFLCSEKGGWINGQLLHSNGGF